MRVGVIPAKPLSARTFKTPAFKLDWYILTGAHLSVTPVKLKTKGSLPSCYGDNPRQLINAVRDPTYI